MELLRSNTYRFNFLRICTIHYAFSCRY